MSESSAQLFSFFCWKRKTFRRTVAVDDVGALRTASREYLLVSTLRHHHYDPLGFLLAAKHVFCLLTSENSIISRAIHSSPPSGSSRIFSSTLTSTNNNNWRREHIKSTFSTRTTHTHTQVCSHTSNKDGRQKA